MKRSEAIQKLILWAKSNETLYFKPIDKQWDEMLRFLEEDLGMLPPRIKVESKTFVTNPETGERGEFKSWTYRSLWEPEDEEK